LLRITACRIEDRIRVFVGKLIEIDENSAEFEAVAAEIRFACFTLNWQIQSGLKNYPPELDRRGKKGPHSFD
jgi:predicted NUDIX family NTP pyrophosphohydrolase